MSKSTLFDAFMRKRAAHKIAPTPRFEWVDVIGNPLPGEEAPVLHVQRAGTYAGRVYQDGREVARTTPVHAFTGDQIRIQEYAPMPVFKTLPPFVRRARIALKRWAIFP